MVSLKLLGVFVLALFAAGCDGEAAAPKQAFEPGQVWTYRTRPGEKGSRVIVCRVENDADLGQIVHVHVNGLRMKKKDAPGGVVDRVAHMPYSAVALRGTVLKLESSGASLPQFEEGYHEWRTKFMQGRAGVWTSSLSEAISGMESVMNQ